MSHSFRLVLSKAALALALLLIVAAPSGAQYLGKPTGPPSRWQSAPIQESVVAEKEMRRVEHLLSGVAATIQELSSTPSTPAGHEEMVTGLGDALRQLQVVHGHLQAMLTDPKVLENRKAALAFSRVHRQLEATATALRTMADSTRRALRDASATSN